MIGGTVSAAVSFQNNGLILAVCIGAIGGFVHEIAQTGGSIAYPVMKSDGVYLGAVSGLLFGGIAGLLAVQNIPAGTTIGPSTLIQTFFAGLGLKGVAEAVGGQAKK